MATCKNCGHYEVCYLIRNLIITEDTPCDDCEAFKDVSKLIELPCNVGDYIEWRNGWGNVVILEIIGFKFDNFGNVQKFLTKYSDIQPLINSEDLIAIIPQEKINVRN